MDVFVPSWCDNFYECRGEVRQEREQDYVILVQYDETGTVDFVFFTGHIVKYRLQLMLCIFVDGLMCKEVDKQRR